MKEREIFEEKFKNILLNLYSIDSKIDIIKEKSHEEAKKHLSNLEFSKFNVSLAYSLMSLFYITQNSTGKNLSNHQVISEIEDIKSYVSRINRIEKNTIKTEDVKRPLSINVEASKRIIKRKISN